jgi:hypothetical protein
MSSLKRKGFNLHTNYCVELFINHMDKKEMAQECEKTFLPPTWNEPATKIGTIPFYETFHNQQHSWLKKSTYRDHSKSFASLSGPFQMLRGSRNYRNLA